MCSLRNLNKTDEVFLALEAENLKAATRAVIEVMSWMDWWTCSSKSMALSDSSNLKKIKHLFVAGTYCQLLVAKTASAIWVNLLLKCHNAMLENLKGNM